MRPVSNDNPFATQVFVTGSTQTPETISNTNPSTLQTTIEKSAAGQTSVSQSIDSNNPQTNFVTPNYTALGLERNRTSSMYNQARQFFASLDLGQAHTAALLFQHKSPVKIHSHIGERAAILSYIDDEYNRKVPLSKHEREAQPRTINIAQTLAEIKKLCPDSYEVHYYQPEGQAEEADSFCIFIAEEHNRIDIEQSSTRLGYELHQNPDTKFDRYHSEGTGYGTDTNTMTIDTDLDSCIKGQLSITQTLEYLGDPQMPTEERESVPMSVFLEQGLRNLVPLECGLLLAVPERRSQQLTSARQPIVKDIVAAGRVRLEKEHFYAIGSIIRGILDEANMPPAVTDFVLQNTVEGLIDQLFITAGLGDQGRPAKDLKNLETLKLAITEAPNTTGKSIISVLQECPKRFHELSRLRNLQMIERLMNSGSGIKASTLGSAHILDLTSYNGRTYGDERIPVALQKRGIPSVVIKHRELVGNF